MREDAEFYDLCECCALDATSKFKYCCCALCIWVPTAAKLLEKLREGNPKNTPEDPACVNGTMCCVGVTSFGCLGLPAAYPCGMCLAAAAIRQRLPDDDDAFICLEDCCQTCLCPPCKLAQLHKIAKKSTLGSTKNKGGPFAGLLVSKMDL